MVKDKELKEDPRTINLGFCGWSKEDRKKAVLSGGSEGFERFVCPLCTLNRSIEPKNKPRIRFDNFDFDDGIIVQLVKTGGRGSGFFVDDDESKKLSEIMRNPEYKDLLDQIKERCKEILRILE